MQDNQPPQGKGGKSLSKGGKDQSKGWKGGKNQSKGKDKGKGAKGGKGGKNWLNIPCLDFRNGTLRTVVAPQANGEWDRIMDIQARASPFPRGPASTDGLMRGPGVPAAGLPAGRLHRARGARELVEPGHLVRPDTTRKTQSC